MDLKITANSDVSVTDFILERFKGSEDRIGMVDWQTGEPWTYRQIKQYVYAIGSALVKKGFEKGDVVVTLAPNCPEHVVGILAVQGVGGIVSGMNPVFTVGEIRRQIKDSTARFVITLKESLPNVLQAVKECPGVEEIFVIGTVPGYTSVTDLRSDDGSHYKRAKIDASTDLALLPYSSGTTGLPKGVMLTHQAIINQIHLFSDYEEYRALDYGSSCICVFPLYHLGGYCFTFKALYQCCTSVLLAKFMFESLLKIIQTYKVQSVVAPSAVLVRLAKDALVGKYDLSSVNMILTGGAPVAEIIQKEISQRIKQSCVRQSYGMTEACSVVHISKTNRPTVNGSSGSSHKLIECKIMDLETGRELVNPGREERGELWVRTPSAMSGYWKQTEKTADILTDDGWIRTGDIACRDEEGNFFIVDRLKELIKYKGFQVAPAELEALILTHPDVADVAVIGVPDQRAGEVPAAYVVIKEGKETNPQSISQFVAQRAAPYKHLRGGVHFRKKIPKNPSGKILRRKLREEVLIGGGTQSKL